MLDPRIYAIEARLEGVERIVAVTGGKGGIGKSFVAAGTALALAGAGRKVGLLDLDLTSPSAHVFLGFETAFPGEETFGIDPPVHHGVHCLSIALFAKDAPAPLRGEDVTNAFVELLAITRWGDLDALVIDMPPGIGDAALDAIRLLPRAAYLVVAGASRVVLESVRRTLRVLKTLDRPVLGLVENMRRREGDAVEALAREQGIPFLGAVPWDEALEDAVGDPERLAATPAARALAGLVAPVLASS